ncbi:minor extracellular protease Epr [Bacillus ectoiniformans]|uniref:S8 family peptidase n=1 Tax=Bacillus ectoiniformans TaxID=1494429 RepID=UPI00195ECBAA|nr:S8 family peptidase [Bacillus ectoiniformans]MBM7648275.1 minor extracellular protease Epr [Bacillus ectoiniformans]
MNKLFKRLSIPFLAASLSLMPLHSNLQTYANDNIEQEVIVVYKNAAGKKKAAQTSEEVDHQFKTVPAMSTTMTNGTIKKLKRDKDIAYIEKNTVFHLANSNKQVLTEKQVQSQSASALSTKEESQWGFQAMKSSQAFSSGLTGKGLKVAVIDTGIANHAELQVAGGVSTVNYTSSWRDDHGHGTHVAGIIGAKKNGSGIVGIAPDSEIYSVKVMDQKGEGTLQDILEGIDWSIANNMDIINLSLGTNSYSQLMKDLSDRAYAKGILLVGASGNSGNASGTGNSVNYPGKFDSVIAVSAVDQYMQRGSFSSVGAEVEYTAPGVGIISTYLNGQYAKMDGTSQAAPHVSGLLALLKQASPNATAEQLRSSLLSYTADLGVSGRDPWYGYGMPAYQDGVVSTPSSNADEEFLLQLEEATDQLAKADETRKLWDYDAARYTIERMPDREEKLALTEQIDYIRQQLGLVEFSSLLDLPSNKTLLVRFSRTILPESANASSVFVRHDGQYIEGTSLIVSEDQKSVQILPPAEGYVSKGVYYLYIDTTITSPSGKALKYPVIVRFTIQ